MSQPVPPPSRPKPPVDGLPVDGNPYAAEQPKTPAPAAPPTGAPVAAPTGAPVAPPTGNPFAGQQPGQPGPPTGNPFAPQQPGQPYAQFPGAPGVPFAPVTGPVRNNLALGLLASFGTALVVGAIYGGITGASEREFAYAAVVVGLVVGWVAGKAGGRNPVLPFAAVVFSLASVYFGQLLADAIMASKQFPVTVPEMFFQRFGLLQEIWKADTDFISVLFFGIAGFASFSAAKKLSD